MSLNPESGSKPASAARPSPGFETSLTHAASRLILGIARHWLALFNLAWGIYIGLPFLAPVLLYFGFAAPARLIYAVYSVLCHQFPDHSYFLFGANLTPDLGALEVSGMAAGADLFTQRQFVGNTLAGFKVAICQRDIAIYGSVLLAGLLFGAVRHRLRILPLRWYLIFLAPLAVDGLTQMFGWRQSDWLLRTATGALFGIASVWLAYPHIDDAMQDVVQTEERRHKPK
jgi:uncharacterized membrane protein